MAKLFTKSDHSLLHLLRAGDCKAFRLLYDRYWDKLYSIALWRLGDSYEAEEVVQDIYTRLWRNREKLAVETEFSHYLTRAVKFEVINRLAKRAKIADDVLQVERAMYVVNEYDIHDRIYFRSLLDNIDQTIETLPEKCRVVFTLSRKEHLSQKCIAEHLEISEKAVQKHISFALKTLREKYANIFYTLFLLFLFF